MGTLFVGKYAALRGKMGKGLGVDDNPAAPLVTPAAAVGATVVPAAALFPMGASMF